MSGVLEQILETLKRIEAKQSGATDASISNSAPTPAVDKPAAKPRGRPVGSTKTAEAPAPKVEKAADVGGDDDNFLDDPVVEEKPTKDAVRAALVAYNKKHNSEQKTRALLASAGGVDNLSALPEEKYAAVIKAATAG